jgi:predicted phage baseplate assembly protein
MPNGDRWSAAALRALEPRDALPRVLKLKSENKSGTADPWTVQRDLLDSAASDTHYTVEVQDDGRARLRFGDDAHGRRPDEGMKFKVTYRVGNGVIGNVGADAIAHLVSDLPLEIEAIANPLPAFGGVDPEDIEAARRDAPHAFRTQKRAVTASDYARAAERKIGVQHAAATFRWTGSWHTVFVTADRMDGAPVDAEFEDDLRRHLEPFRIAGYDLEVDAPRFVPLEVSLHVCVKPEYVRSQVLQAVRAALSNRRLPDGRLGVFHPDNFTFGQSVYSSRVLAAAQSVEGVESVRLEKFQCLLDPDPTTLENGVIPIGRLGIAQLENNPNYRERGRLTLSAGGGK